MRMRLMRHISFKNRFPGLDVKRARDARESVDTVLHVNFRVREIFGARENSRIGRAHNRDISRLTGEETSFTAAGL